MAGYGINWGLLQQPDIGNAFTQGFTTGRTKATLGALSKDPNDTNALNALMQTNPDAGFEFQDRQIRRQDRQASIAKSQQEQQAIVLKRRALAAKGAKDPQTWDAVAQQLVALGDVEAGQAIGKFTPEYRMAVMASGGVEDDDAKPTALQQNYEFFGQQLGPDKAREYLEGQASPMQWQRVEGADGSVQLIPLPRNAGGGDPPSGEPAPSGVPVTGQQIEQLALSTVPGAIVTSGARTPEHNREVGGVPNSFHVTDQARDLVPPRGMTMSQFYQTLKGSMPGFDVINEGDHIHIEPQRRGGAPRVSGAGGIQVSPPKPPKEKDAPSGYQWSGNKLTFIPGGPADPNNQKGDRKTEADLRKEFDNLPEVKEFTKARTAFQTIRALGTKKNATAADDLAMIFSFMKSLDPTSTVREGEFANAQNATGIPERVRNQYNAAITGERLNPKQRLQFVATAATTYKQQRETYNGRAQEFRGYAQDYGVSPDRVAKRFLPTGGGAKRKTVAGGKIVKAADGVLEWKP